MSTPVQGTLDFAGGGKITGLPTPSASSDAVPKSYVDTGSTIDALSALDVGAVAWDDRLLINDDSDTTAASEGTYKKTPPQMMVAKQTAQVTNSSNTTPSDVTGLAFPVKSGRRYRFKFYLKFQTAATTTGIGFLFSGPTMTDWNSFIYNEQAAAGTDGFYAAHSNAIGTALVSTAVVAASTDYGAIIEGTCAPSADGTLQLRVRSEVNASQVTVQQYGTGEIIDCG